MNDETTFTQKNKRDFSHILTVSVRGWIALIIVMTVCYMSLAGIKVEEPMYTMFGMIAGLYFGQNPKPKSQQ